VVEGLATTFNQPYLLWEDFDGTKYYEQVDAGALMDADLSDVIMQYDHEGRVYARTSNNTLSLETNDTGIIVYADLSRSASARELYDEIKAGLITKMSWAFRILEDSFDRETKTRTILQVKKVYDVSAVSFPANPETEISARSFCVGVNAKAKREMLGRRLAMMRLSVRLSAIRGNNKILEVDYENH
jgi:HK97 family phage prohead protease